MPEFIEYVLYLLKNSLILVLLAGIVAVAAVAITYLIHKRKYKGEKKFPWGKGIMLLFGIGIGVCCGLADKEEYAGMKVTTFEELAQVIEE